MRAAHGACLSLCPAGSPPPRSRVVISFQPGPHDPRFQKLPCGPAPFQSNVKGTQASNVAPAVLTPARAHRTVTLWERGIPDCSSHSNMASECNLVTCLKSHPRLWNSLGLHVVPTAWRGQRTQGPPLQKQDSEGPPGPSCRWCLDSQMWTPSFSKIC